MSWWPSLECSWYHHRTLTLSTYASSCLPTCISSSSSGTRRATSAQATVSLAPDVAPRQHHRLRLQVLGTQLHADRHALRMQGEPREILMVCRMMRPSAVHHDLWTTVGQPGLGGR